MSRYFRPQGRPTAGDSSAARWPVRQPACGRSASAGSVSSRDTSPPPGVGPGRGDLQALGDGPQGPQAEVDVVAELRAVQTSGAVRSDDRGHGGGSGHPISSCTGCPAVRRLRWRSSPPTCGSRPGGYQDQADLRVRQVGQSALRGGQVMEAKPVVVGVDGSARIAAGGGVGGDGGGTPRRPAIVSVERPRIRTYRVGQDGRRRAAPESPSGRWRRPWPALRKWPRSSRRDRSAVPAAGPGRRGQRDGRGHARRGGPRRGRVHRDDPRLGEQVHRHPRGLPSGRGPAGSDGRARRDRRRHPRPQRHRRHARLRLRRSGQARRDLVAVHAWYWIPSALRKAASRPGRIAAAGRPGADLGRGGPHPDRGPGEPSRQIAPVCGPGPTLSAAIRAASWPATPPAPTWWYSGHMAARAVSAAPAGAVTRARASARSCTRSSTTPTDRWPSCPGKASQAVLAAGRSSFGEAGGRKSLRWAANGPGPRPAWP